MLARDWRAGELRVLAAALVIAVASVTSVGFFADRVGQALVRDAHQLLGADLVLVADHPLARETRAAARARRGRAARGRGELHQHGARAARRTQLAGVKAVTENYPLRGRLRIAPALGAPDAPRRARPAPGQVWIEERLVTALGAPVGSTRQARAKPSCASPAILTLEPERSAEFLQHRAAPADERRPTCRPPG